MGPTDVLTPLQLRVLRAIGSGPLGQAFHLTGGTALAACYLQHRYSEDLDMFTIVPNQVRLVPDALTELASAMGLQIEYRRRFDSFMELLLREPGGETLKMDFAQDAAFRFQTPVPHAELGVRVDSLEDIACNKFSCLFDRHTERDFIDVYFLHSAGFPFPQLFEMAKRKHVGLDDYWLAQALLEVRKVEILPRMIQPVTIHQLRSFFENQAVVLTSRLLAPDRAKE